MVGSALSRATDTLLDNPSMPLLPEAPSHRVNTVPAMQPVQAQRRYVPGSITDEPSLLFYGPGWAMHALLNRSKGAGDWSAQSSAFSVRNDGGLTAYRCFGDYFLFFSSGLCFVTCDRCGRVLEDGIMMRSPMLGCPAARQAKPKPAEGAYVALAYRIHLAIFISPVWRHFQFGDQGQGGIKK